jgi:hypothetical protein
MNLTLLIVLFFLPFSAKSVSWNFPPQVLSSSMANASNPYIVSDTNGNFVAAWIENGVVKANTQPTGGSWGSMSSTVSNGGASSLQLAMDGAGTTTAIWIENGTVASSSLPLGGSWSAETILSGSGASAPQIAADTAGDLVAIWVENGAINSMTKISKQPWPQTPDVLAAAGDSPQIAMNGNGFAGAVWHEVVSSVDTIFFAGKSIGASWTAGEAISNSLYHSVYPKIAVDSLGNVLAAWFRYTLSGQAYSNVIVQSASLPVNGSWQSPVDVSSAGLRNPADLQIQVAFNGINEGLMMWINSFDGSMFTGEGSFLSPTGWISPVQFLPSNLYGYSGGFSLNNSGYASGAFMGLDSSGSGNIVVNAFQVNTYSSFLNSTTPQTISSGAVNGYPSIASAYVGGASQIAAVWLNNDGMFTTVQTANGTSAPLAPPANLSVVQSSNNYGLFTEYVNTLSWNPPSDPLVAGCLIYRNGLQIASYPPNLSYIDHNQAQNSSVTYGVSFIMSNGDESATSTVNFP